VLEGGGLLQLEPDAEPVVDLPASSLAQPS
jgi:hypothetical protein